MNRDTNEYDLDVETLRQRLSHRVIGKPIYYHRSVGSTMDETKILAKRGEPEGAVVIAEEQTAGRGRFNRPWVSPPGLNLSFSVLLRPTTSQLAYLNMASTLAVCKVASEFTGATPMVKWPNDVRIDGRKLSGILIETEIEAAELRHVIIGIGVNINFDPSGFPEIADTATSMIREAGHQVDRTAVIGSLLEHLDDMYADIKSGRSLTRDWAAKLETLGRTIQVSWQDQVLEGRAEDVDEQGNLILVHADGSRTTVVAGEVTLQV